jgi:hypothetical protein
LNESYATERLILFCNTEELTTLSPRPPCLLMETATPREGESVSGTTSVRKGSVARMHAGEKYISAKGLKGLGAY